MDPERADTTRHRTRRFVAAALVVVFALGLVGAGSGIWLRRTTLNNDVWAARVAPLGSDPAVQRALAAWTTDELLELLDTEALLRQVLPGRSAALAVPLSSAVDELVADQVDAFYASERFEQMWTVAGTQAHERAVAALRGDLPPGVSVDDEGVVLDLAPVLDAIVAEVLAELPRLVGLDIDLPGISVDDVPDDVRSRLGAALGIEVPDDVGTITVYEGGELALAQRAVAFADRFVVALSALTVVAAIGALAVTPRRRRTLLQLLTAALLGAVGLRQAVALVENDIVALVPTEQNRAAAQVVVGALVDPLTGAATTVAWLVLAAIAAVALTGPYPWAVALRQRGTRRSR